MNEEKKKNNWKILKSFITSKYSIFNLNKIETIDLNVFNKENLESEIIIYSYKDYNIPKLKEKIIIKKPINIIKINDKDKYLDELNNIKIDKTGIIDLWPSEELLTYYIWRIKDKIENKKIIELGCGYSGLASIIISKYFNPELIIATDGNNKSIDHLNNIVFVENNINTNNTFAKVLLWNRNIKIEDEKDKFDIILISDCLFFRKYHIDLCHTIKEYLNSKGECIILSPKRGNSLKEFLEIAINFNYFNIEVKEKAELTNDEFPWLKDNKYDINLIFIKHK